MKRIEIKCTHSDCIFNMNNTCYNEFGVIVKNNNGNLECLIKNISPNLHGFETPTREDIQNLLYNLGKQ